MAKIGYARVSTKDQNLDRQLKILNEAGAGKIFEEKASGKNTDRPALTALMDYLREGDILIVESYSRLARSTRDLLSIVDRLQRMNVSFISLKEKVDTSTPAGKLMLTIFAGLAEFERECSRDRQLEGIAIARANGKYRGRKPVDIDMDEFSAACSLWKDGTITATEARQRLGLKKSTFYRRAREYGFI